MQEFESKEFKLKCKIYGSAPVQAEGTISDFYFYFRARHNTWTFSISENPEIDPVDIQMIEQGKKYGFFSEGQLGKEWEHLASYIEEDRVREIILSCVKEYLQSNNKK
jgi:hypothetical protein